MPLTEIPIIIARIALELQERRTVAEREPALVSQREAPGCGVHDILGHSLTVFTLRAEVARRFIERDPAVASRELDEVITPARGTLADVRSTVTHLRSPDLDNQIETTRAILSTVRIRLDITDSVQGIPECQHALMARVLREATTNVTRHAQATTITVHLESGLLQMNDDGADLAGDQPGNGLAGLRSHCEQEGGSFTVISLLTGRTDSSGADMAGPAGVTAGGTGLEVRLS